MTYAEIRERAEMAARESEYHEIASALDECGWNISATARSLSCPFSTLRRAVGRYPDLLEKCGGPGRPRKDPASVLP